MNWRRTLPDKVDQDFISDRALRYRRNAIIAACTLVAVHTFPEDQLAELTVLGVNAGAADNASYIVAAVAAGMAYNAVSFLYLAVREYRTWLREEALTPLRYENPRENEGGRTERYPEVRMFFGFAPRKRYKIRIGYGTITGEAPPTDNHITVNLVVVRWRRATINGEWVWQPTEYADYETGVKLNLDIEEVLWRSWTIQPALFVRIRAQIIWFWGVEIGAPGLLVLAACALILNSQAPNEPQMASRNAHNAAKTTTPDNRSFRVFGRSSCRCA